MKSCPTYDALKEKTVEVNLKQYRIRCLQMKPPQFSMWVYSRQGVNIYSDFKIQTLLLPGSIYCGSGTYGYI